MRNKAAIAGLLVCVAAVSPNAAAEKLQLYCVGETKWGDIFTFDEDKLTITIDKSHKRYIVQSGSHIQGVGSFKVTPTHYEDIDLEEPIRVFRLNRVTLEYSFARPYTKEGFKEDAPEIFKKGFMYSTSGQCELYDPKL